MKFKEYVEGLVAALKDNPAIGEYDAIYSRDDEGNSYQFVNYNTCLVGVYDGSILRGLPSYLFNSAIFIYSIASSLPTQHLLMLTLIIHLPVGKLIHNAQASYFIVKFHGIDIIP